MARAAREVRAVSLRSPSGGRGEMLVLSLELTEQIPALSSIPIGEPIGILVLIGFAIEGIWRLAQHMGVIAHEGAHALTGWAVGRKSIKVKLHGNASGETFSQGPEAGPGRMVTSFAGYLGPSMFGLGAAVLLANHQVQAVLIVAAVALFFMLIVIRNSFGCLSVLLNGGLIVLILKYGNLEIETIAAYALSWFLLLSGVRFILMPSVWVGDADTLRRITPVPRVAWATLWLAGSVLALWIGGRLLV